MSLGADMIAADLARSLAAQTVDEDASNTPNTGDSETLDMERQYFGMARDMNEVLVSKLHDAAARDNLTVLKEVLNEGKMSMNHQDNAGNTPAHWAAGAGALKCLEYLLDLECDVKLKNFMGDTPLHRAGMLAATCDATCSSQSVWRRQVDAVRLLVDKGILDLEARNNANLLALDLARDNEIKELLRGLAPLDSVAASMLADENDLESSDEAGEDNYDDETREYEFNALNKVVKRTVHADDSEDDDSDNDEAVDTLIVIGEVNNRTQIVSVGRRRAPDDVDQTPIGRGPPPPVPSRDFRKQLFPNKLDLDAPSQPRQNDDNDDDDQPPPLEAFDASANEKISSKDKFADADEE